MATMTTDDFREEAPLWSARKTKFRATVEVKLTTDKTDEAESMINDWLAGESQPDSDNDWSVTKVVKG